MRQPVPFGKYLLLDRISVGGMAEVFKAKSYGVEGFEKIIAIKRILPTMGEDRDFIKMFIDEAKIAGQLAHANICQIFELGRIDGSHFIAMEYIWGKDLLQIQNRLRKIKQPMPIPMACFSIAKVLEGLDYAHRKRDPMGRPLEIVHRDCSPQNVLVSYEGEVKIIDFGIAKATSRNSRTMAGVLKGKFGYMSPEQVRGLPLDRRSDIFALGTMLYECLTGDRLFQGETDFSTLEKVRNVDIQNPRALNPAIPEEVEKVILKALAKDVDDRYQWCSEMLADLQQFLMSQDVVFTAKSLSSWLKEVFLAEIERERQQLEQYKRVGRDGLIAGVPAAEAKLDVVETLGEAGPAEGDPTMLGGPSFDDIEQAVAANAAPEVGPAPGSPAARGGPLDDEDDGEADFGEEAPTEIFGEIDEGKPKLPVPAAGMPPPPVSPAAGQPAMMNRPTPRPPPMQPRPSTQQPMAAMGIAPRDSQPPPNAPMPDMGQGGYVPAAASPLAGYPLATQQPYGQPPQPYYAGGVANGTPNAMPVTMQPQPSAQALAQGAQGRTLLGAAPVGLPNYGQQGYPPPMVPQPGQPYGYPSSPNMLGAQPGMPMQQQPQMYPGSPYAQQQNPYGGSGQYLQQPVGPVDPAAAEGRKKSSIARDVAIGVAIAALVLGGFLIVKFFVLDGSSGGSGSGESSATQSSSIATIRLSMPAGISADLFVDDKKAATVSDKQEIPVTAGQRKVRLVGPSGSKCEQDMSLPAGKTTTLECALAVAGSAAVPTMGSGSATVPAGSGLGSAAATKPDDKTPDKTDKAPVPDKTDKMPVEDKKLPKPDDKKTVDKKIDDKKLPDNKKTQPPEDDLLGNLQGGTKPGDKKTDPKGDKKVDDKKADAPDPTKGYLALSSKPPAKILIDGNDSGVTTSGSPHTVSLAPGKHKVTFVIGNDKTTYQVTIKAGETTPLDKNFAQ